MKAFVQKLTKYMMALIFTAVLSPVFAADIYVDIASTAETEDGSQASPYKSIKAGVDAANTAGEGSTVYVKGGEVEYTISSADDFSVINVANTTLCAWGDEKPVVHIAEDLSVSAENPLIFTISAGADNSVIRGFSFKYYRTSSANNNNIAGHSLGLNGAIISISANNCIVEACTFSQTGKGGSYVNGTTCLVRTEATQQTVSTVGAGLVVRGCVFNDTYGQGAGLIKTANDALIVENIYQNCMGGQYFVAQQQADRARFISNRVVNCSVPMNSNGFNHNENDGVEIAYNIIVGSDVTFLDKKNQGMYDVKIHHNTIIGLKSLATVSSTHNTIWCPNIFDNLIILDGTDSSLFVETGTGFVGNGTSAILSGSTLYNNAYFASAISSGTATKLSGYALQIDMDNNISLATQPTFIEIEDVTSPDYYRPKTSANPLWTGADKAWTGTGVEGDAVYPAYIGAVEPLVVVGNPWVAISAFEVTKLSPNPEEEVVFTVQYDSGDLPADAAISVTLDFGDGKQETLTPAASENTVTFKHAYGVGIFDPKLTVKATSGGEEVASIEGVLSQGSVRVLLENVYVDCNVADNGDGREVFPLKSISEALSVVLKNGFIHIKGGVDRVYVIETAEDLISVNKKGVTFQPWGDFGTPQVEVSASLSANVSEPYVITIEEGADKVALKGLAFTFYTSSANSAEGQSLGKNGRLISILPNDVLIESCSFTQVGPAPNSNYKPFGVVCSAAEESLKNIHTAGLRIFVRDCEFNNIMGVEAAIVGNNGRIHQNVYNNCNKFFKPTKQSSSSADYPYFISNRVINAKAALPCVSWNWATMSYVEIAYNVFIGDNVPFLFRLTRHDFDGSILVHHNTVIGCSEFVDVDMSGAAKDCAWTPQFFDNLVVLNGENSSVICEMNGSNLPDETLSDADKSSFNDGTVFRNNAWYASCLVTNEATRLFIDFQDNNIELAEAPAGKAFVETEDFYSEDFYRPRESLNPTWIGKGIAYTGTGVEGEAVYPDYIGAVEPQKNEGTIIFLR